MSKEKPTLSNIPGLTLGDTIYLGSSLCVTEPRGDKTHRLFYMDNWIPFEIVEELAEHWIIECSYLLPDCTVGIEHLDSVQAISKDRLCTPWKKGDSLTNNIDWFYSENELSILKARSFNRERDLEGKTGVAYDKALSKRNMTSFLFAAKGLEKCSVDAPTPKDKMKILSPSLYTWIYETPAKDRTAENFPGRVRKAV